MSAHVLVNLLNELGKRDKMRGLPSILSLFRNKFNKFNNTGARFSSSQDINLLTNRIFGEKISRLYHLLHNVIMESLRNVTKYLI